MKIQFKRTPEQVELIKAMASSNREEREKAQSMFAALVGPELGKVYLQEDTTQNIFKQVLFPDDNDLSMPIDPWKDVGQGHFTIWTTQQAGSVFSNEVAPGIDEVKFITTQLESAYSFNNKYAEKARLDVVAGMVTRLLQEVLLKTNYMCWQVLLKFLAEAVDTRAGGIGQVFSSRVPAKFTMDDWNSLLTKFRRLNSSWVSGTPSSIGGGGRPTDFYLSPESMESLRQFSYNSISTKGALGFAPAAATDAAASAVIALPESERAALYASGGVPTFYGIQLNELLELGKSQDYQIIFEDYIGSTTVPYIGVTGSSETFDPAVDELIIVVDATKDFAYKPIIAGQDYDSVFTLEPDDQFLRRSKKTGFAGGVQIGSMCTENRSICGMIV